MIAGASNAVNLTDGLDGLATGASTMVFGAYTLVNIWQNNQSCELSPGPKCYEVRDPLDLAVIAAALTGACFGFLWWNASPAKIFMGDTGSLSLGGALAGLAILTRTEFLLAILGGLFVIQTLSVMLQVGYFKATGGQADVPDGAAAPPLRAEGLGRDHRRGPVLDHHRAVRRHRSGGLLRRVGGGRMTPPPTHPSNSVTGIDANYGRTCRGSASGRSSCGIGVSGLRRGRQPACTSAPT